MYQNDVLRQMQGKKYITDLELSKKMKINLVYVQDAISKLLVNGQVFEVGKCFSETFGKLFFYYTSHLNAEDNETTKSKILTRQYSAQKLILIRRLIKNIQEHHGINSQIKRELEIIETQNNKIELSFHALDKKDLIFCYRLVITHGICAESHYLESKVIKPKKITKRAA